MIILAVWGAGGTIHFPIITTKGKPITHTVIPITTIPVVPGIRPIMDTTTTIRTLIAIIGIHTLTIAVTGGLDHLQICLPHFFGIFSPPGFRDSCLIE
jgi:hypothetical protein